ncbi:MAG: Methicillin resistance protein [Parcubacteria group bacterium GW2011_GWC2_45_7]|nr:MAG: Methicillin resistance protein [Parcubacteria group bacterium GW2011_GWC2_45_7]KKU73642.1 MAG: Methicillin resistance protein [Parcubacteria group bacterium GW2011_GWA2_47_26]
MLEIKPVDNPKQWNDFLLSQPTQTGIFLQSWQWLDFQEKLGRKVWRVGVMFKKTQHSTPVLVSVCGIIKHELPFGKCYLYSPRGPIINEKLKMQNEKWSEELIKKINSVAQRERAIFWRLEPLFNQQILHSTFYILHSIRPIQPKQTLVIGLTQTEDELMSAMHEKTRYNIRLATRKGIEVREGRFEEFWQLMQETAKRDKFSAHPRRYYEKMLEALHNSSPPACAGRPPLHNPSQSPLNLGGEVKEGYRERDDRNPPLKVRGGAGGVMSARLHIAYHGITPIAAAIVAYFGDTATYLHGASSYKHRALMSSYVLHWHVMQDAKKSGYRFYDFWGIAEKKWPGITRFKLGFGGTSVNYSGTFDLPLSRPWYILYRAGRKIQRII